MLSNATRLGGYVIALAFSKTWIVKHGRLYVWGNMANSSLAAL